jgi:hypothetical protein
LSAAVRLVGLAWLGDDAGHARALPEC